ncbi:MAG: DUF3575 domain-containing protein [Bacteroidales bacterium]|nr:DUF3575 domain-containing protein [Bacteroidales bacterium]
MKKRIFLVTLLMLTVLASLPAYSQSHTETRDSSKIEKFILHYRVNETELDDEYMDNKMQLHKIRHYFANSPRIDSVTIYSWASPEGGIKFNTYLSKERGKTAKRLLLSLSPDSAKFNSGKIKLSPVAENWEGLEKLVEERYFRHDRDNVLKILRTKGISDETRKWRLQQLNEGYSWKILVRRYMPELRAATWICVWAEIIDPMPEVAAIVAKAMAEERPIVQEQRAIALPTESFVPTRKTILAFRSNLLVPALNIGLEVPIKYNWSVGFDYYYPWAVSKYNHWCTEMLGWFIDGKYWFPGIFNTWSDDNKLIGHAIGVYAGIGYYDYQNRKRGAQGEYLDVGIDYTYARPIAKNKLRLEFNIGFGAIRTYYRTYQPSSDYTDLIKDPGIKYHSTNIIGPTRASVSLVLPITVTTGRYKSYNR